MPGVKSGSVDDVNAVGTRDIGGRGMGNWYSTETEIRMGKSYAMQLEKSVKFVNDPVVTEYVNRVAQNLVKNSDAKVPFTIKVIDSDEVNAMALPGGFMYVNSGLILTADDEAEMAGVIAHEISHVAAHHAVREQTRMNYAQLGTIPLIFIGGWTGYGIYEAAQIGIPVAFLQFSRGFESQADFLGVQYMYRAGYDPQAFVTIFEKLENLEKTKPHLISKAFSTHPQTPDRIEATQKEIATILPPRAESVVTMSRHVWRVSKTSASSTTAARAINPPSVAPAPQTTTRTRPTPIPTSKATTVRPSSAATTTSQDQGCPTSGPILARCGN
jgi:beta-barrel assembly-enhancing protease